MSDLISVQTTVVGDAQIKQRFQDFGDEIRVRLRKALTQAGQGLVSAAQAAAPRRTGRLQNSIKARLAETDQRMTETVRPGAFYARFIEFGVVSHGDRRNKAFGTKLGKVKRVRALRSAGAYRIRPRPFMGPAMASMRERIQASIDAAIGQAVSKANS